MWMVSLRRLEPCSVPPLISIWLSISNPLNKSTNMVPAFGVGRPLKIDTREASSGISGPLRIQKLSNTPVLPTPFFPAIKLMRPRGLIVSCEIPRKFLMLRLVSTVLPPSVKSATDSAISCSIIRPAPANAIRLCCPASRSKATTTTVAIARPWATAHLRTCQGAGEKIYYNAEGMCRLKQSNGEDSTTRSSGSLPCLNSTPGLAALKASQFCRFANSPDPIQ